MNTTLASTEPRTDAASDMTETTSVDHGSRISRATTRRFLALLLACATLAVGVTAGSGDTAEAAPGYSVADVCFKAPVTLMVNGRTYWGPYSYKTVTLDVWLNGQAVAGTYKLDGNGCTRQVLPAGYYWRFRVYNYETLTWYVGQSDWQYASSGYTINFGTVWLSASS